MTHRIVNKKTTAKARCLFVEPYETQQAEENGNTKAEEKGRGTSETEKVKTRVRSHHSEESPKTPTVRI